MKKAIWVRENVTKSIKQLNKVSKKAVAIPPFIMNKSRLVDPEGYSGDSFAAAAEYKRKYDAEQKEKETCHYEEGKGLPDEVIQLLILIKWISDIVIKFLQIWIVD